MKKIIALGLVLSPVVMFAATGDVGTIIAQFLGYIKMIVPVLITLAIGFFIWGVIQFMSASDEEA